MSKSNWPAMIQERTAALLAGWVAGMIFGAAVALHSWWCFAGLAIVLGASFWVAKLETNDWLREQQLDEAGSGG